MRFVSLFIALIFVLGFLFTTNAWSQTPGTETQSVEGSLRYFDFFVVKGGWIAYVLIVISVIMLALAIEHSLSIRRATFVPKETARRSRELIEQGKYLEAIQFTGDDPTVLGYVLHAGLMDASNGYDAMERAVMEALDERSARFYRKIEYINVIGNVSPMIGLFGTVFGMILLFAEIHAADGLPGARIVADRMAVALITTFWGLAVAIPALSIYALFRNRIDVLTAECALMVEQILSYFGPGRAQPPTPSQSPPETPA